MESFRMYKNYGIRYYQITGTTVVEDCGLFVLKTFRYVGEIEGSRLAEIFIDNLQRG